MRKHFTAYSILLTAACAVTFPGEVRAQQLPQFSQYMLNPYVINPAASSMHQDVDLAMGFRQQWTGFDGAPQTYYVGGTVNIGRRPAQEGLAYGIPISNRKMMGSGIAERKSKHVVGGLAAVDEYGLFQRNSVMASYAYHHPIGEKYYLAAGTSMGWYGMNFGAGNAILENPNDNTFNDFIANGTRANLFDINAGLMFYSDRLFAGYSVYQIGENQIELGNAATPAGLSDTRLAVHHFAMAGYRFTLNEDFDLTPSTIFKLRGPAPPSFDVNVRVDYAQRIFLGLSYRYEDAVSVLAGLHINDWLRVGYAYDYLTSQINNLSSGSHEIVLGVRFDRKN